MALIAAAASTQPLLAAPKVLGPNKCTSCHDHDKQKAWADKDKHAKALDQLEDKKSAGYAKAIGLADPYDLKGSCVSCHATVFNGDANAGVSCETCHGAGSDYVEPHQQKGSYQKAVSLGMIDTRGNLPVWAKMCVDCHILKDAKLLAAGHKSGADFDVGASKPEDGPLGPELRFREALGAGQGGRTRRRAGSGQARAGRGSGSGSNERAGRRTDSRPHETRSRRHEGPGVRGAGRGSQARGSGSGPASAPTEAPKAAAPAPAPPVEKSPQLPAPPPPPPPVTRPTLRPGEIAIEIQATPIPSVTPQRGAPAPGASAAPAAPPGSAPPAAKPKPKPRPRRTHAVSPGVTAAPAAPLPTRTPTRRPAPAGASAESAPLDGCGRKAARPRIPQLPRAAGEDLPAREAGGVPDLRRGWPRPS